MVYRNSISCIIAIVTCDVYNVDVHKINIGRRTIGEVTNRLSKRKARNRMSFTYIETIRSVIKRWQYCYLRFRDEATKCA